MAFRSGFPDFVADDMGNTSSFHPAVKPSEEMLQEYSSVSGPPEEVISICPFPSKDAGSDTYSHKLQVSGLVHPGITREKVLANQFVPLSCKCK